MGSPGAPFGYKLGSTKGLTTTSPSGFWLTLIKKYLSFKIGALLGKQGVR